MQLARITKLVGGYTVCNAAQYNLSVDQIVDLESINELALSCIDEYEPVGDDAPADDNDEGDG